MQAILEELFLHNDEVLTVQEEPELDIALPQVFAQPPLTTLQRGKLPHVELLVTRVYTRYAESNGTVALGPDYQALVNEFQPLFTWATACWDYLLSTEGCRFVLRTSDEKLYNRGDYRVVTDKDYSRLSHRIFRGCVLDFAREPSALSLSQFLRAAFWPRLAETYRRLEDPPDPRQRRLTAYSYLRCIPYRFLNDFHHELVSRTLARVPQPVRDTLTYYFLHFFTLQATADVLQYSVENAQETLRRGLIPLLLEDRLVYCLLRQIERY